MVSGGHGETGDAKVINSPLFGDKEKRKEKRKSPLHPYKRKARGKENKPCVLGTGLSAGAGARRCERIREREARRKREVEAAVEDALVAFYGTRRNPLFDLTPWKDPCDERMWANAAWALKPKRFLDLIDEAKSQIRQKPFVVPDRDKPSYFQTLLNPFWKRGAK